MKKIFLGVCLVFLFCSSSPAETSVWKIERGNSILFLGGTCHILRPSDFPLPPEFDKAYRAADLLVFETDIGEYNKPETLQKLMLKTIYTNGSTLEQHLSPRTYQSLQEYCAANGISIETLNIFKPGMLAFMLETIELLKLKVTQEGVDLYFYNQAKRDGKLTEGLETVEEQMDFIAELGQGDEDGFVTHTLNELRSIKQSYENLVDAWKKGDTGKLEDVMVADLKKEPKFYKRLLTDRNSNWLPLIDAYAQTPQKEFILVGVGHLVGPDGILEALRQKGYKVEKL
ncbi:hypothetical protein SAMN04489760_10720 [Syntrophus gentianae]|uniref:TraB family protein n=1 Tax=Syntrophus gentianae TaxID=43775 RepID=A0A1H7WMS9_9BACT|nr:TraB/GumN family protein [Syntrophus gentianae]SEM22298.1 hypothetical protein SAMN04489760_10720 [Syntrophus gentianae]